MKTKGGFTLLEVLVAVSIVGILAGLATVNYISWIRRANMERQIRQTYADISQLRVMAKTKTMTHFMTLGATQIRANEDTNNDGALSAPADRTLCLWDRKDGQAADPACPNTQSARTATLSFPMRWSGGATLGFDSRGIANANNTICIDFAVNDPVNTSYDCIDVSPTRISIGKLMDQGGACSNANCEKKN